MPEGVVGKIFVLAEVEAGASLRNINETIRKNLYPGEKEAAASGKRAGGMFSGAFKGEINSAGRFLFESFATGAALATAAFIPAAIHMASEFQASMQRISSLAQVPQSSLAGLSKSVLKLAGEVGFSPTSLSEALYHVESVMAGMIGPGKMFASLAEQQAAALATTKVAAEGAKIGGADLILTTNALTAVIAAGKLKVTDYSSAMGQMLKIVGTGDMTMQDFTKAMGGGVLAMMSTYGMSLKDFGAGVAVLGDHNIRGAKAATYLKMAMQDLGKIGRNGAAELATIGLTSDTLAKDMRTKGLIGAISDLRDHLIAGKVPADQWGEFIVKTFTKKAGPALAIFLSDFGRLQGKYDELNKAGDNFASAWDKRHKLLQQNVDQTKERMRAWMIELATALMPIASKGLEELNKLFDWIGKHKDVQDILKGAAIGASALAIAFGALAVSTFLLQADFAPFILAGMALGAALYYAWTHSKLFRDIIKETAHFLVEHKKLVLGVVGAMMALHAVGKVSLAIQGLSGLSKIFLMFGAFSKLTGPLMAVTKLFGPMAAGFRVLTGAMMANPILAIVIAIAALAAGLVYAYNHSKTFHHIVVEAWKGVQRGFHEAWNAIKPVILGIGSFFKGAFGVVMNVLRDVSNFFTQTFHVMGMAFSFLWNTFIHPYLNLIMLEFKILWNVAKAVFIILAFATIELGKQFVSLYTNVIQPIFSAIGAVFSWLWTNAVKPTFDAIGTAADWLWNNVLTPAWNGIQVGVSALGTVFNWLWNDVVSPVFHAISGIANWLWHNVIEPVSHGISAAFSAIGTAVMDVWNWFSTAFNNIWNFLSGFGGKVASVASGMWDGLKNGLKEAVNWIIDKLNGLIHRINDMAGALSVIGVNIKVSEIHPLATGTMFAQGGLTLVGERGPELVNMPRGAQVQNADQTKRTLAGSGDGNITVHQNFYGPTTSGARLKEIDWTLRYATRGGSNFAGSAA